MAASSLRAFIRVPSVGAMLLGALFTVLWIAGGASRADAPGQLLVRAACWAGILVAILSGPRPDSRPDWPLAWHGVRLPLIFLCVAILIAALQLVPLPPDLWQALPGRARFGEAVSIQPWRPLAIVPDAAVNALASLVVPFAVLVFAARSTAEERTWLPGAVLVLVATSALLGVLQFSGAGLNNPLVNFSPGDVSGTFANRNHFSLFLALGCLIAPIWAFMGQRQTWRAPVALGLVLLFVLVILASGSRAGILLAMIGVGAGLLLARRDIKRALGRGPRWLFPAVMIGIIGTVAIFVLVSVAADRAMSVERVFAMQDEQDMRTRGLPVVLDMIGIYFPVGSGFGGFDPMFRLHEPFALLKPTYFNHAHNDFAEIALDGGLPSMLLLVVSLGWWAIASVRAWRADAGTAMLPRLGSAMLLLILVASTVDYPARTPMMMAMIAVAALLLGQGARMKPTLPARA